MKKIRTLGLILLAAFTFGSASALASNVGIASNNKDTASVTTVAYQRYHQRHRVRRLERYRGRDGRWHRHYVYVYVLY
jgi:hypothetical protein